jgi:transcriptional regulator PpsR
MGAKDETTMTPDTSRRDKVASLAANTMVLEHQLEPDAAKALIAASGDVSLVVGRDGRILHVEVSSDDFDGLGTEAWTGKPLADVVTVESREKCSELLAEAAVKGRSGWRQLNHPSTSGADIPLRYSAVSLGPERPFVVVGRDLRSVAQLQRRLVEAQQAMEREYARIRNAETRYQLLFQLASEAILIVDAVSGRVVESNPAASRLLGMSQKRLNGLALTSAFNDASARAVQSLIAAARTAGRIEDVHAQLGVGEGSVLLTASLFRTGSTTLVLVRIRPIGDRTSNAPTVQTSILQVIDRLPEAFVVTDMQHNILAANASFLDLAQIGTEHQCKGQPISRWLGRPGVELDALFATLRNHGTARSFSTIMRGEFNRIEDVDIAAVQVETGELPCIGLSIRPAGGHEREPARGDLELPNSEQFTELVGRVALKEIVRETTDVIERLCIEAALELTGDNRASAAEMLGVSRQSLYSKLRRFGLVESDSAPERETE